MLPRIFLLQVNFTTCALVLEWAGNMRKLINVAVPNRAIFMRQQAFDTFEINSTRDPLTFANITAIEDFSCMH